ncbi:hypothetical protein BPO_0310 [Bergeyella porcorum]|uniref:Uncharacterized protein n=1 Tax=Bergeyella porcorum TaxID=1735111 RepID=A0AAU0F2I2_9FLAO
MFDLLTAYSLLPTLTPHLCEAPLFAKEGNRLGLMAYCIAYAQFHFLMSESGIVLMTDSIRHTECCIAEAESYFLMAGSAFAYAQFHFPIVGSGIVLTADGLLPNADFI